MYLAIIDLMVALEEGHVRNEGRGLRATGADKWVPAPALPVAPSPSYGILCALQWRGSSTGGATTFASVLEHQESVVPGNSL